MNYEYLGIYMREPSGIEGKDRCWIFIAPNDCSLIIKVPSEYTEDDIRALVESLPNPAYIKVDLLNPENTTIVRVSHQEPRFSTGMSVEIFGTNNFNGVWQITKVDDSNFDLDGAIWTEENGTDTTSYIKLV